MSSYRNLIDAIHASTRCGSVWISPIQEDNKAVIDEYIDQRIDLAVERLLLANPELIGRTE